MLLFFSVLGLAQNGEKYAAALLDSNEMLIGDRMTVHYKVELGEKDRVLNVVPTEPFDSVKNFEVVNEGAWKLSSRQGRNIYYRDIVFTVWDTGLYKMPIVAFTVENNQGEQLIFSSNPVLLTVKNPAGWDKALELAPIKDIIKEEWRFEDVLPYVMIGAALILLSIVGWFLYKKLKKEPEKQALQRRIVQPPHVIALEKLSVLKNKNLWQKGEIKEYYSELSHILREYLERQLTIPALESTTEELIILIHKEKINDNWLKNLQELLQTADLVKFAKGVPPEEVHDMYWQDALTIVEKTKPKPIETAAPESTGAFKNPS